MAIRERAEQQGFNRARQVDLAGETAFSTEDARSPDLELWASVAGDASPFLKVLVTDAWGDDHYITHIGPFTVWWEIA